MPPPSTLCCCLPLFVLLTLASLTAGQILIIPPWLHCPSPAPSPAPSALNNGTTADNSSFRFNVVRLLEALPSSAAAASGFASLYRGSGGDRAFVRGLCRGDVMMVDCETCLQAAAQEVKRNCSSRRGAIWYEYCFLSYADTNASTSYEERYRQHIINVNSVVADKVTFEKTYYALMGALAARAANGTPEAPSTPPMFVTAHAVFDRDAIYGTIYGLVQCIRDRPAAECGRCLQASVPVLPSCCSGYRGGVVVGYNCYLRMEVSPFYDLELEGQQPVPPLLASPPSSSISFVPRTQEKQGKKGPNVILAVALPIGTVVGIIVLVVFLYKWKAGQKATGPDDGSNEEDIGISDQLEQLNLQLLRAATDNFSEENKLGEGGFGEVFKGTLKDGEQIAVKRLSKHSSQGFPELKNELVLAAKLKHKNVAPLVGVCLQQEKLLVYEYMPNSSLDTFLFDPVKRMQLDWGKRFMIICGIARGLRYLHEESRLMVIHRDLKPSNVLLDADMNPKISDFGLARAFGVDQSRDVTRRPAGTLGYMSPEYAYCGHVSSKSDMFSFGVIVLEMVTGRKSSSSYEFLDSTSLLSYAWKKWSSGSAADLVDASLQAGQYPEDEVLNCLEVGLLCVQENPVDRPDASAVVLLLGRSNATTDESRLEPSRPAFFFGTGRNSSLLDAAPGTLLAGDSGQPPSAPSSQNKMTISDFHAR